MEYEYHRLNEGLAIYKQKRSKNYYIRLRVKDDDGRPFEFKKSLKTDNKDEAVKIAWGHYYAHKNKLTPEAFTLPQKSSIKFIADELLKVFNSDTKKINKDYARVLENEVIPELGKFKVKELERGKLKVFISQHANSTTQVQIRKTVFKHLFDLAVDLKVIKEYEVPSIPTIKVDSSDERPMFTAEHLELFKYNYNSFISSSKKEVTRRYRILFKHYMTFLHETGVRPGEEALNITFDDLKYDYQKALYSIRITKGKIHSKKKSSYREIPLSKIAVDAINSIFNELWDIPYGLYFICDEKLLQPRVFLFRLPGKQDKRPQFEKQFSQLCNFYKLDQKELGYSLYSYRHTYITNKLVEGTDVYLVASNVGTSIEMIERYYSKLKSVMRSEELVGKFSNELNF